MNPIRFPQDNIVMRAPAGLPEGACVDVHAFSDGHSQCVTCWEPTPEERAAIAAGGPVWISVHYAGGMPPVGVFGLTPFLVDTPTEQRIEEMEAGAPACIDCIHFTSEANSTSGHCARWEKSTVGHYHCREHSPK